jgi:Na+/melibiose symporter-like transporter
MTLVGIGIGMTVQNLVLSLQNTVAARDLGAATATITFFRSLGGAIGVAAMGAVLAHRVSAGVTSGLSSLGVPAGRLGGSGTDIPNVATLPAPIAHVVQHAYGAAVAHVFLFAAPLLLLSVVLVSLIREVPLRQHSGTELMEHLERDAAAGEVSGMPIEHVEEALPIAHMRR